MILKARPEMPKTMLSLLVVIGMAAVLHVFNTLYGAYADLFGHRYFTGCLMIVEAAQIIVIITAIKTLNNINNDVKSYEAMTRKLIEDGNNLVKVFNAGIEASKAAGLNGATAASGPSA